MRREPAKQKAERSSIHQGEDAETLPTDTASSMWGGGGQDGGDEPLHTLTQLTFKDGDHLVSISGRHVKPDPEAAGWTQGEGRCCLV